ncbi:hypothetical protein ACWOE8_07250 [Enterococcus avium]
MKNKRIKFYRDEAIEIYKNTLELVLSESITPVYQVKTFPLNNIAGLKKGISSVPHGCVLWQHTDTWHTTTMYIKKGRGKIFNRDLLDLVAAGVDTLDAFEVAWDLINPDQNVKGYFPKVKSSKTSSIRQQQASFIVADFDVAPNPESTIKGSLYKNRPHRTHLIPAQTTGIENHRGLLIDFDGWLNMNSLKRFETNTLNASEQLDLIWSTNIWRSNLGLHFQYIIYDTSWNAIYQDEWIDDRWTYIWYFDK